MLHPLVVQGQRWVSVDLDQPDTEVLVDHEIKSKKLVAIPAVGWIHLLLSSEVHVETDVLHASDKISPEVELIFGVLVVEVCLKVVKTYNVAFLMNPISFFILNLQTVIGEMHAVYGVGLSIRFRVNQVSVEVRHVRRLHLLQIILRASRTQVPCVVKIEIPTTVSQAPDADVELPGLVEQRPFKILLDHPV